MGGGVLVRRVAARTRDQAWSYWCDAALRVLSLHARSEEQATYGCRFCKLARTTLPKIGNAAGQVEVNSMLWRLGLLELVDQHAHALAIPVGDSKVRLLILIEVAHRNRDWMNTDREVSGGGGEAPLPVAH